MFVVFVAASLFCHATKAIIRADASIFADTIAKRHCKKALQKGFLEEAQPMAVEDATAFPSIPKKHLMMRVGGKREKTNHIAALCNWIERALIPPT